MKAILLPLMLFSFDTFAQSGIDTVLKRQLDSVMELDQQYRAVLMAITDSLKRDSIAKAFSMPAGDLETRIGELQNQIDSSNLLFIESIFQRYGYPGISRVGTPANEVAWYVIQHSDKIGRYIPLIRKAGKKNELPFRLVAMMEDRYLVEQYKEQLYGTQVSCRGLLKDNTACFVWPIKDPERVNERRRRAGFVQTVEENARRLGTEYRVVRLSEVR